MADEPVKNAKDLRLGMEPFACKLAKYLNAATPTDGALVVGLSGSWGSGKTSVLHAVCGLLNNGGIRTDYLSVGSMPHEPTLVGAVVEKLLDARTTMDRPWSAWFLKLATGEGPSRVATLAGGALVFAAAMTSITIYLGTKAWAPLAALGVACMGAVATVVLGTLGVAQKDVFGIAAHVVNQLPSSSYNGRHVLVIDDLERLEPEQVRLVLRLLMIIQSRLKDITVVMAYDRLALGLALNETVGDAGFDANLAKYVNVEHAMPLPLEDDLYYQLFVPQIEREARLLGITIERGKPDFSTRVRRPTPRDVVRATYLANASISLLAPDQPAQAPFPVTLEVLYLSALVCVQAPDAAGLLVSLLWAPSFGGAFRELGLEAMLVGANIKKYLETASDSDAVAGAVKALLDRLADGGTNAILKEKNGITGAQVRWSEFGEQALYGIYLVRALNHPEMLAPPPLVERVLRGLGLLGAQPDLGLSKSVLADELTRLSPHVAQQHDVIQRVYMAFHGHQQLSASIVEHVAGAVDRAAAAWPNHTGHLSKVLGVALDQRGFSDPEYAKAAMSVIQVLKSPALLHYLGLNLRRRSMTAERQIPARFESLKPVLAAFSVRMAQFGDMMTDPTSVPVSALGSAVRVILMIGDLPDKQTRREVLQRRWARSQAEVASFVSEFYQDMDDGAPAVQPLIELDELFGFSTIVELGKAVDSTVAARLVDLQENLAAGKRARGLKQ